MNAKKITVGYSSHSSRISEAKPKITMEGKWLESLGFNVGDKIKVEFDMGIIKITPYEEECLMVAESKASYPARKMTSGN